MNYQHCLEGLVAPEVLINLCLNQPTIIDEKTVTILLSNIKKLLTATAYAITYDSQR